MSALGMRRTIHQNSTRNSSYNRSGNQSRGSFSTKPSYSRAPFQEIEGAAFFIGKLNKNHDREVVYNALRRLTKELDFYIRKLDMPYACNKTRRGNCGYAFVHCNSKDEAQRIIAMRTIHLGKQVCEVKAYAGRGGSNATSGYNTPDRASQNNTFVNPLKEKENVTGVNFVAPASIEQPKPVASNNAWHSNASVVNIIKNDGMNKQVEEDQSSTSDLSVTSESATSFDSEASFNNAEAGVYAKCEQAMTNGMTEQDFALLYENWYNYFMQMLASIPEQNVNQIAATLAR